jgi:Zn-dependent metalloprotease
LAESDDPRLREIGRRNLATTTRLREQRAATGRLPAATALHGEHRLVYDAHGLVRLPGRLVRRESDGRSADRTVNEAFAGLGATYDLFAKVYDRDSIDDRGMQLRASVHYSTDYDNAFWDGSEMVFGDGDGIVFVGFTTALDVIGHELTHGVTQFTSNLDYAGQPGALNESFSDVFGSMVKQYHLGQDAAAADWLIGAGILARGIHGVALRSMKAPGTAYDDQRLGGKDPQPAHMRDYRHLADDEGGVHLNSGIPNRAFYLAATAIGGPAWETAGRVWYDTLRQLPSNATFADCAAVTRSEAERRFGSASREARAIRDAWWAVGVVTRARARRAARPPRTAAARARLAVRLDRLARSLDRAAAFLRRVRTT